MIDLQSRPNSLVDNYKLVANLLRSSGPESLQKLREKSLSEFEKVGIPTSADEEFKYVSLKVLEEGRFAPAYGATVDRHQAIEKGIGAIDAITLAFVNGEFAPELSSADLLPDGVFVGTIADAMLAHEELVLAHLGKPSSLEGRLGTTNDERFVHLNTAYLGEGAMIYVPRGVEVERPIHVMWLSLADHGPFASHPRTLVILEENSRAKVLESYVGLGGIYFTNAVTEVSLGKAAVLELNRFQNEMEDAVHISTTGILQEATSNFTSNNVNFGGKIVRNDINVWVGGEHAETSLNGVAIGVDRQVIDNHTRIDHAVPHCHSFETYKTVLRDTAHGVFNGKIFVYKDAQKTDAKQTNQALLLSRTATMSTKPQLEIFADDVKCTHGATIGQLREDALFYLQSRGIPKDDARSLLVYAFAAAVLEKISIEEVKDLTEKLLFKKLELADLAPTEG